MRHRVIQNLKFNKIIVPINVIIQFHNDLTNTEKSINLFSVFFKFWGNNRIIKESIKIKTIINRL